MTKERQKQFQIETYILSDKEKKIVVKKALTPEAVVHIQAMSDYYKKKKDSGSLCESYMYSENEIAFEYLDGNTLCNEMLNALQKRDKEEFFAKLEVYRAQIYKEVSVEKSVFRTENICKEIFGEFTLEAELELATDLNIDMTFDNLIFDEKTNSYKAIDYEWAFDFALPIHFVIYRAVTAFYYRNNSFMEGIASVAEIYQFLGITEEELSAYEQMNLAFNNYVYGGAEGYNEILKPYKKEVYDISAFVPEDLYYFQLFWDTGNGFNETDSVIHALDGNHVRFEMKLEEKKNILGLRIDPLNVSGKISNVRITLKTQERLAYEVKKFKHNATVGKNGLYIFDTLDPQMIVMNKKKEALTAIIVEYDIVKMGSKTNRVLDAERELDFIKSTFLYRVLLKRKIDKAREDIL